MSPFKVLALFCLLVLLPHQAFSDETPLESTWIHMPAGARQTYMGIHGGTMPVSLLVTDDGSSLLTFVGRTGNDFLELLHTTKFQLPSFLKGQAKNSTKEVLSQGATLSAGNKISRMPVIYITGMGLLRSTVDDVQLQPFGLSEKPIAIEGKVHIPSTLPPKRKEYRLFFEPRYLTPR